MADPAFTFFPRLPLELRLWIWRRTMRDRVVRVSCRVVPDSSLYRFSFASERLQVFEVCRESRSEARRGYVLLRPYLPSGLLCRKSPSFYFNPNVDTIYLTMPEQQYSNFSYSYPESTKIKSIALEMQYPARLTTQFGNLDFQRFRNITHIALVHTDGVGEQGSRVTFRRKMGFWSVESEYALQIVGDGLLEYKPEVCVVSAFPLNHPLAIFLSC